MHAALVVALLAAPATANHWHAGAGCGAWNGIVHGESSIDGYVRTRVEQNSCPAYLHQCVQLNARTTAVLASDQAYSGLCSAPYDGRNGGYPEYCSYGFVYYRNVFGDHYHYAHNYSSCR
jgi:hypothetical protein